VTYSTHSIAVTLRIARFASGESDRPELPQGDLIGSDPADSLRAAVITAQRAWALTDRTRVCHLSFGDFEAETAAGINLVDVLAHGWDISPLQGDGSNVAMRPGVSRPCSYRAQFEICATMDPSWWMDPMRTARSGFWPISGASRH